MPVGLGRVGARILAGRSCAAAKVAATALAAGASSVVTGSVKAAARHQQRNAKTSVAGGGMAALLKLIRRLADRSVEALLQLRSRVTGSFGA